MTAVVIDRALSNDPPASLGDQRRKQEGGAERSAPVGAVERRARESFPSILSGRRRRLFAVLLANGAAQAGAAVAFAFCVTWAGRAQDPAAIAAIVALAAGLFWLRVREIGDSTRLGLDFVAEVRLALFDGALDPGRRGGHGVAMSRMTNDLAALKNWAGYGLARSFTSVLAFSGCLAAAATMSWAYVASIAVPACLILALGWILAPRLSERVATVRAHRGRLANRLAETLLAIDLLRAHDQIARRRRLIRRRGEELNEALLNQMQAASLLRAAPDLLAPIAFVGALGLGAPMRGESVAFLLLAGLAAGPLRQALRALEHRATFLVARERLRPGLGEPSRAHPRTRGDAREKTPQAAVQTCRSSDDPAFKAAGARGAVVTDDAPLLSADLARNIDVARLVEDRTRLSDIAQRCRLLDEGFAPDGLETRLNPDAGALSVRRRSRLALARAIASGAREIAVDAPALLLRARDRKMLRDLARHFTLRLVVRVGDLAADELSSGVARVDKGRLPTEARPE